MNIKTRLPPMTLEDLFSSLTQLISQHSSLVPTNLPHVPTVAYADDDGSFLDEDPLRYPTHLEIVTYHKDSDTTLPSWLSQFLVSHQCDLRASQPSATATNWTTVKYGVYLPAASLDITCAISNHLAHIVSNWSEPESLQEEQDLNRWEQDVAELIINDLPSTLSTYQLNTYIQSAYILQVASLPPPDFVYRDQRQREVLAKYNAACAIAPELIPDQTGPDIHAFLDAMILGGHN